MDVALIDNAQRGDQLAAEEGAAPPLIPQGRQRRDDRVIAHYLAEIALDRPQRDDEARLHAKALLHPLQERQVFGHRGAAVGGLLRGDDLFDKAGESHLVLGLLAVELDDTRQVLGFAQRIVDRAGANSLRDSIAAHRGQVPGEIAVGGRDGARAQWRSQQRRSKKGSPAQP